MKKHLFLASSLFFLFHLLIAQCPEGNVTFRSQERVDNFVADYPDCTIINGNLSISTSTINNPDPIESLIELEKIIAIRGSLAISDNALIDLSGLQNITSIEDNLYISSNNYLKNIDGLLGLTTIGRSLIISRNDALENLDGLQNITIIQGDLQISRNDTLINLKGLQNITTIGGSLKIERNRNLSNIMDLAALTTIGEDLDIWSNDALTSLKGLENLTAINGHLKIGFNQILNLCNTPAICNLLNNNAAFPNQIVGNGTGCNNENEILEECLVGISEQNFAAFSLFPNPSTGIFKLSLDENLSGKASFYLYNAAGEQLKPVTIMQQNTYVLNYSFLPNGVYYLNILLNDQLLRKKLVILK